MAFNAPVLWKYAARARTDIPLGNMKSSKTKSLKGLVGFKQVVQEVIQTQGSFYL